MQLSFFTKFASFIFSICIFITLSSNTTLAVDSNGYWEKVGSLNTPRLSVGYILLNNGNVLIAGSYNSVYPLNTAEIFNPATKLWSYTGSMITPRQVQVGPGVAKFSDGKILIGGHEVGTFPTPSPLTEIYDPGSGDWKSAANLNVPRIYATLLPLPHDKAISVGGSTGYAQWSKIAEVYDYASDSWKITTPLNIARQQNLYALALSNGKIILIGGQSAHNKSENTSEIFDPMDEKWTLATMPFYSNYSAITELADGRIFAAGSYTGAAVLNDAALYDTHDNTWSSITPMPQPRGGATAVLLDDGNVLIVGGNNGTQYFTESLIYNPSTNSWLTGPSLPTGFNGAAFVKLQNGDYLFTAADEGVGGPGTSTYLFTNGNTKFLNIPYFSQNDEPWGLQIYDHADLQGATNPHIERWGCAITSAAMILNYHGMREFPNGTPIDPGSLNHWLKNNNGFSIIKDGFGKPYSVLNWGTIGVLTQALYNADKASYKLVAKPFTRNPNLQTDLQLRKIANKNIAAPPIVRVSKGGTGNGHYVVPKGIDENKILINDPEWNYEDLSHFDSNNYTNYHSYIPSMSDYSNLYFVVNENIELLVTDPNGKKTGIIINKGLETKYDENNNAIYIFEGPISNPTNQNEVEQLGNGANIYTLSLPNDGVYKIQLTSMENTFYTLNASAFEENGTHTLHKIEGILGPNKIDEYTISYSKTSKSEIKEVINFDTLISDINSLYKLKEIKNKNYYNLLLGEAYLAKKLNNHWYSKVASRKVLKVMDRNIERSKDIYLTQYAYYILKKELQFLLESHN